LRPPSEEELQRIRELARQRRNGGGGRGGAGSGRGSGRVNERTPLVAAAGLDDDDRGNERVV